jgi:outer membrane murein-binding lipoprotein Lpp
MLQTAQLGWLNHELNVENASGIRKVATASQELSASSARLEETMRQLSQSLAGELKELANRLDTIQSKVGSLK